MSDPSRARGGAERSLLAQREVLLVVGVGALTSTARWLEMLAVAVFVFDRTGSAFLVAAMTVLRMLPLALFGAFAGALAERVRRKAILMLALVSMSALSVALCALALGGRLAVWQLALGALIGGVFWATDFPVRRTLLGDVVAPTRLAGAMGLDVLTNNGSRVLGPVLGGMLLQGIGIAGAYALSAMLYLIALGVLAALRHVETSRPRGVRVLASLAEGVRYLASDRTLTGIFVVTVIFNVFGFPFLSMVPVIGRDVLELSASATGALASVEGAGVLIGASALMLHARVAHYRRLYYFGVVAYMLAALLFAQSGWASLSALALLANGLAGACFSTMQSTLVMLCAEPAARMRMMGVLSVCIGTAPIGLLHLGWLAERLGAQAAVGVMTLEGLLALVVAVRIWPEVAAVQAESQRA